MKCAHRYSAILAILNAFLHYINADFEHVVSKPESIVVNKGYQTLLLCEMNIQPDKFEWKFYPTDKPYNSKASADLSNGNFTLIPQEKYKVNRKRSEIPIQVKDTDVAGDYQCLAYYGASVVASIPWRITLARMSTILEQKSVTISVQAGNIVSWRCDTPESNPEAYVDYHKADKYIPAPFSDIEVKSMILENVNVGDSGIYTCIANNGFLTEKLNSLLKLEVLRNSRARAPSFIIEPTKEYTVTKGSTVFLECPAFGNPIPKVTWLKKGSHLPSVRSEMVTGGLIIKNINSSDDGVYICKHENNLGSLTHQITLKYNEEPSIDCLMNSTNVNQGENLTIDCEVKGIPEPQISWFLNGFSVLKDSSVEAIGNKIQFKPVEKRHAGNLQIFARNILKTIYSSISVRVIPLSSTMDEVPTSVHTLPRPNDRKPYNSRRPLKHKLPKMIPPSRPIISRLDDETVVVRWTVPTNNGLPIQFLKVQFKEIGPVNHKDNTGKGSGWNTANTDILPNIKAYDVTGLKADYYYKFRVAAVYTNNDSKMSPISKKFHLRRLDFHDRNPLPVCTITYVETVNHTAIKIYWECPKYNVTIDGFYISYIEATRAGDDYMKSTVEGESTRNYVINYLQPETSYDIKLQSFTSKLASDFSPLMKGRTGINPVTISTSTSVTTSYAKKANTEQSSTNSNLYIIIAGGVIAGALVIVALALLFVCRRWKRKKLTDNHEKPNTDHIQSDMESKAIPRSNGCVLPGNKITITSNPLADAENKNPNVMEMRNLANNNVRLRQDAPIGMEEGESKSSIGIKERNKKSSSDAGPTESNYV